MEERVWHTQKFGPDDLLRFLPTWVVLCSKLEIFVMRIDLMTYTLQTENCRVKSREICIANHNTEVSSQFLKWKT